MPKNIEDEAYKQLKKVEKMHPDSSESSIIKNYLETLCDLPWSLSTKDEINIDNVLKILNQDHFELKEVKERIIEYIAVKKLKKSDMKGPILCLNGPPGVGKTSLAKSIARSIGREFVRISLGGIKDEAEIRGHRKTYVGAMPGRIIQALKQTKTNNPVILLDEIDKISSDFRGNPSAALLEVLDPEQNKSFADHYLNLPFDLSNIIFIATSNDISEVFSPLKDRMEIIQISGYTQEEKVKISEKYLIPKQMEENGINKENILFLNDGIESIIKFFTAEAGLRNLERKISAVCRKVAIGVTKNEKDCVNITESKVLEFLGAPIYSKSLEKKQNEIGVASGLAWTSIGGEVLQVEVTSMKGKGLTLTGQLGDVMKESAQIAIGYIRSNCKNFNIPEDFFENNELHIHLPYGAIPKDGPSAGITLTTAIISLITQHPFNKDVAMTGEITLTGKVLPIGGLKEKALAAMRMNIKTIIIPWENKKDLEKIPQKYRDKINFILIKNIYDALTIALVGWKSDEKQFHHKHASVKQIA